MNTQKFRFKHGLKFAVVLGSMVLLTSLAQAETATPHPATAPTSADSKKAEPEKNAAGTNATALNPVLSIATGNWSADRKPDVALLLKAEDQADLYLYVNDGKGGMELKLVKKALVWSGALAGTLPKLTSAKKGVLYVDSQNEAVGRNRWEQRLTLAYRNNEILVTGYTYTSRDTLDPKSSLSCDFDLVTGKGLKNKHAVDLPKQQIKLSDWQDDNAVTKQCRN